MQDTTMAPPSMEGTDAQRLTPTHLEADRAEVVSTHVLVEQDKVDRLRELSRRTRVAQSEYLREAVDDLLTKYDRKDELP